MNVCILRTHASIYIVHICFFTCYIRRRQVVLSKPEPHINDRQNVERIAIKNAFPNYNSFKINSCLSTACS